jgi:hypothetical protein
MIGIQASRSRKVYLNVYSKITEWLLQTWLCERPLGRKWVVLALGTLTLSFGEKSALVEVSRALCPVYK